MRNALLINETLEKYTIINLYKFNPTNLVIP